MKSLVKSCFCLFVGRVDPVATLPSALIEKRLSLGARCRVGSPRCSRCCHLFIDLSLHHPDGSWAGRLTQSPVPEMSMLSPKLLDALSV